MSVLERVADPGVDAATARGLGVASGALRLRRAWPRGADHLLLEYRDATGRRVAGQWFADADRLRDVAAATRRAAGRPTHVSVRGEVLLQAGGADRKLRALSAVLAEPGAGLVVHRPERRAVVRLAGPPESYAKVVRPGAAAGLVAAGEAAAALPVTTPRLLAASDGVTRWSALPGALLHDRLGVADGHLIGRAVRAVHATPPPMTAELHDAVAEVAVCDLWLARLAPFDPELALALRPARDAVAAALIGEPAAPTVTVHRDLHDKQVLIDDGRVGLLDFDLLAAGEAALDLANLLVHLELRALQGLVTEAAAHALAAAVVDGYAPDPRVRGRLAAYAAATRLRLCAVYRFRAGSGDVLPALRRRLLALPPGVGGPRPAARMNVFS